MRQPMIDGTGPAVPVAESKDRSPEQEGTGPSPVPATGPPVAETTRRGWRPWRRGDRTPVPAPAGPPAAPAGEVDAETRALLAAIAGQGATARARITTGPALPAEPATLPSPAEPAAPFLSGPVPWEPAAGRRPAGEPPSPRPRTPEGTQGTEAAESAVSAPERDPWWLRGGLNVAVWCLTAVTTVVGSSGQIGWAEGEIGATWEEDPRALAAPAGLELLFVALLLLGVRSARNGGSLLLYWLAASGVGGFAVYTNTQHQGATYFAGFTGATLILWFFKLRDELRHYQRTKKRRTSGRPAFGLLWATERRLTWRAWRISIRRQIHTIEEALRLAEVYIAVEAKMRARTREVERKTKDGKVKVTVPRYTPDECHATAWEAVCVTAGDPPIELPAYVLAREIEVGERVVTGEVPAARSPRREPAALERSPRTSTGTGPTVAPVPVEPEVDEAPVPDTVPAAWTKETPRKRVSNPDSPVSAPPADGPDLEALAITKADKVEAIQAAQRARGEDWMDVRLSGDGIIGLDIPGCKKKAEANLLAKILDHERVKARTA